MNIQPQPPFWLYLETPELTPTPTSCHLNRPLLRLNRYVSGLILGLLVAAGSGAIATATTLPLASPQPSEHHSSAPDALESEPLLLSQAAAIQRGDQGGQVEALQKRLAELGYYSGPVTGFFGEMTEVAVMRFQEAQGLTADGIVGSGTATALRQAGRTSPPRANNPLTLEVGDQGPSVETLQNQLTRLGHYEGPITGYFGSLTEAALMRFQSAQGLTADGIVGSATQAALDRALGQSSSNSGSTAPNPNDGVWETGENGETITTIQRQLQVLGFYNAPIDGDFGSNTEAAVREFQRSRSLTVDGKAGPQTMAALLTATQAPPATVPNSRISDLPPASGEEVTSAPTSDVSTMPTVTLPSTALPPSGTSAVTPSALSNEAVLAIQRQLREQGFYNGALDGQMGPETQQAILEAQQSHGLQPSDFNP